ncbi:MAG: molybdenum cofactor guanylyltransferase [Cyanobium sp.]
MSPTSGDLLALQRPVTLLSHHPVHGALAEALGAERAAASATPPRLSVIREPEPREGPLRALARLMAEHPEARLLLCPVDMPWLDLACLQALIAAADEAARREPAAAGWIHLAHDGQRPQPLLGLFPSLASRRQRLEAALAGGERGVRRWLAGEDWRPVRLPPGPLRNVNHPEELPPSVSFPAANGP